MKHTPKIFTLSVALMALSLTSCGSGIDNEEEALPWCKEDVCDEGGASLLKCDIDTGRTTLKLCPFGCSNGTCKVSPTAECFTNADCPATKPVCASGTCVANDTPAPPAPECNTNSDCPAAKPVCSNGTCIANDTPVPPAPECNINSDCPAAKPVCSNGTCVANDTPVPPAPECNINSDCPAAKPVCSNGTCIENSAVADVACQGVTCAKGTCDRGVCVTDEMKAAKEGDPCDDNFADFCRGDSMVFCSMANKVVVESCAQDGGCGIVNEKLQGGELLLSWCNGPSDQCKTEGQKIPFCTSDADGKSFESSFVCAKNTEGKFTAKDQLLLGEYKLCAATCNADNTACDNSTPAPECKTHDDCKDPTKPVCSNGTCVANDTPEPPAPECKTHNDCKDPTKPVCSNGTCVANDTPEPPAPECKTHNDCKDQTKPVCINGACSNTCDNDTFAEVCIGSTGYYCNEGKPAILECASAGLVCEKIKNENYIDCYDAKTACTQVGATDTLCQEIEGYVLSGPAQCKEMESGAKHFVSTASSFSDYTQCNPITQTCDAQGKKCITYATTTDTTCSEDTAPKCENGKLVTCENVGSSTAPSYKLVDKDCSIYNGGVCATADGAETICAPSQSTCTQGQREQVCVDYRDLGLLFVQFTTECKQYSNNTWQPAVSYIFCEGKCNADNTACEGDTPKPECTQNKDCPAAKPVCENGKCVENSAVVDVACQGVTCAKGTCDRGVCVTDEMKAATEGAPCDGKTFGEFCNGDSMVYCGVDNNGNTQVSIIDCSNDGGCSIVKDSNGEYASWCNGPSDKCKNDNQAIPYCGTDTDGTVFESSYICIKNTEGKFTAQDQSLYQGGYTLCATKCNADNTACQ